MKKAIIYTILASFTLLFVQCDDFLTEAPRSDIAPGTYWKSKKDADFWMAGIYNLMQSTLRLGYFYWGEVRSDNADLEGRGTVQQEYVYNRLSSITSGVSWRDLYKTIMYCNLGLKYLKTMADNNVDGATHIYEEYMGQCYAMRALMYFYAMRTWGRVPIVTEALESLSQEIDKPRSSIKDVRAQIEEDIESALKSISGDNTRKFYINKAAVYALQTDVYAWFQEYDNVIVASDAFLAAANCKWITKQDDWKALFMTPAGALSSTETVFTMYWDRVEASAGMGAGAFLGNQGTSDYREVGTLLQKLLDRYNPKDLKKSDARYWFCFDTVLYKSENAYNTTVDVKFGKFAEWDGKQFVYVHTNHNNTQMPIYRYADVMTLRAEALARTGKYDESLNILRAVRARMGYTPTEQEDPTNFMAYYDQQPDKGLALQYSILDERQLEFMGEGKRWFDLCRIGKTAFTKPYYDESGGPGYQIPADCYQYLRSKVNKTVLNRAGLTDYEDENINRVFFPIISGAFNANPMLVGDQNYPYSE